MAITEKVKKKLEDVTVDLKESVDSLKEEVAQIKDRLKGILPTRQNKSSLPIPRRQEEAMDPFRMLQMRTNQLFEDFWESFGSWGIDRWRPFSGAPAFFEGGWPRVDVSEDNKEIVVKAELPGVDEKDIDVSLADDALTIRGESRVEEENKGRNYHCLECFQGSFTRTIPIPVSVESDKAEASFKKHVLTVKLPKTEAAQKKGKRIEIKSG